MLNKQVLLNLSSLHIYILGVTKTTGYTTAQASSYRLCEKLEVDPVLTLLSGKTPFKQKLRQLLQIFYTTQRELERDHQPFFTEYINSSNKEVLKVKRKSFLSKLAPNHLIPLNHF